jgi:hypothetical protein
LPSSWKPPIDLPGFGTFKLNEATLASMDVKLYNRLGMGRELIYYRYIIPASVPASLTEYVIGGHVVNFKSYGWGANAVCTGGSSIPLAVYSEFINLPREGVADTDLPPQFRAPRWSNDPTLSQLTHRQLRLREQITVNTYAEWGPTEQFVPWPPSLWIGVDEGFVYNR